MWDCVTGATIENNCGCIMADEVVCVCVCVCVCVLTEVVISFVSFLVHERPYNVLH